jgi:hypothetical protein
MKHYYLFASEFVWRIQMAPHASLEIVELSLPRRYNLLWQAI